MIVREVRVVVDRRHAVVEHGGEVQWEEKMEKSHH